MLETIIKYNYFSGVAFNTMPIGTVFTIDVPRKDNYYTAPVYLKVDNRAIGANCLSLEKMDRVCMPHEKICRVAEKAVLTITL